ncbi:MAG: PAS domain S-box protein [Fibrobacter sp.]|nr:PAS domain S-box protein [Fibrobacter sp.]
MTKSRLKKEAVMMKSKAYTQNILEDQSIASAAIFSSISPIAFLDCVEQNILFVNHAFLSIWGYDTSEEVVSRNASDFWQSKRIKGHFQRKIQDRGGWIGETVAIRKDGSTFPVQVSATMLVAPDSTPRFEMFSFIDISEKVHAQNEQRRLLADLKERIKELNCLYNILSIQSKYGTTVEEILRYVTEAIPPSLRWPQYSFARIAIGDVDVRTPNFKTPDVAFSIPLQTGMGSGILEVGYDCTSDSRNEMVLLKEEKALLKAAAKEIERLIEYKWYEDELHRKREHLLHADKLSSIGVLSAEIMHEIGNPNNYIALNTRILTKAWDGILPILDSYYHQNGDFAIAGLPFSEARDEVARLLAGITEGSERIRAISSHLKTFLAKKSPSMDVVFDINDAVSKAIEFSRSLINLSTDNFRLALNPDKLLVKGNDIQIQQIIINLLTNACQALTSRNNMVSVTITHDKVAKCIKVIVEDEGKGIHPRDLPHVTDPFFTTKKDGSSTGLGLSISNDIAISHGGRLTVNSVLNHGTQVVLILPEHTDDIDESDL